MQKNENIVGIIKRRKKGIILSLTNILRTKRQSHNKQEINLMKIY